MKNLLLVKYSDGRILIGDRDDSSYTKWVFEIDNNSDIIDTMLVDNKEARQILIGCEVMQNNKSMLKKLSK